MAVSYNGNNWLHVRSDAEIPAAADLVLLSDGFSESGDPSTRSPSNAATGYGLNADYSIWNFSYRMTAVDRGLPRHHETNNVLYADGHVKSTRALKRSLDPAVLAALEGALPYRTHVMPTNRMYNGDPAESAWN